MIEHRQALERVQDQIIERFSTDDPVEQEKIEGVADLGAKVATFLAGEIADEGSWVDTGFGLGQYDCHVIVGAREYHVAITAGRTEAEMAAWEAALGQSDDEITKLEKRILEALRVAGHYQLATEFEAVIDVCNIGGGAASVDTLPGQDREGGLGAQQG